MSKPNRSVTVGAIQTSYGHDLKANIAKTEALVREAAEQALRSCCPRSCSRAFISARAKSRSGSRRRIPLMSIRACSL